MNTIIEKIRAEVERRIAELENDKYINIDAQVCRQSELKYIDRFLDTLQEQPVCEDLKAEVERCVYKPFFDLDGIAVKGATHYLTVEDVADIARHFANWQKEQMMKEAVERIVKEDAGGYPYIDATELYDYTEDKPLAKKGDKVKIIIVKEEGK